MRFFFLVVTLGLVTAASAQGGFGSPEYCIAHYIERGAISVGTVTFSGTELSLESSDGSTWTVPFDAITVELQGHDPMTWDSETTELGALMDWIETALSLRALSGINPLAIQDVDGHIWLVSTFFHEGEEQCFAHLLNLH